uniref:Uncharacterized protein n=1 Tax=Cajanus cajan TaxID=3821 RepID=A0A151S551_CAJCA|nr:hypothetical protein KK1_028266 [Cajanus cajan]
MSFAEIQLRREKGLCFTCDDKYSPSHKCPNKKYLWFHLDEEEFSNEPVLDASVVTGNIEPQLHSEPYLSFNALKGSTRIGTMRFKGVINGLPVQILLDSGSSDNFLQPRIVVYLKLPVEPIHNFNVMVGNGSALVVEGLIKRLEVTIQNHAIQLPAYLLPRSGADLVLGASWLATLGAHISDYSNLSLKFMLDDKFVTLMGEQTKLPDQAQFHHLRIMFHTNSSAKMYSLHFQNSSNSQDHLEIALLLHTYHQVFDLPCGLPSPRSHNHVIPLVHGSNPIKVKPYSYPFSQKQQIEYLGHTISGSRIAKEDSKVQAILAWPLPTSLKQLRGFLGLTSYYRRFIKGYATLAGLLTKLLKKKKR